MAVPQNKITKSRRNMRRAHDALNAENPGVCPECGEMKRPHHVCPKCGAYKNREVFETGTKMVIEDDAA